MAFWPADASETARWVAALTSPSTPGVVRGYGERSGPASVVAPAVPSRPPLTATVDLECPYLRGLVLDALARRRSIWTTIRADPIVTVLEGESRLLKPAKPSDDGNTTSEDEGDGGDDDHDHPPPTLLTPHPAVADSLFHWGEYERIDWDRVHASQQAASSYCVRKGLTRKAHLAFNLKKWAAKHAGASPAAAALAAATPETHVLQVDGPEYVDEALADLPEVRDAAPGTGGAWILKPSLTNRGAGIAIIDSPAAFASAVGAAPGASEWVAQRYITPPHLLGGRKWHLRLYALAVGALEVWVYGGGALVLRARAPYHRGDGVAAAVAPLTDLDAHLTNTCRKSGGMAPAVREAKGKEGGFVASALRLVAGLWRGGGGKEAPASAAAAPPPAPTDPVTAGLALSLADLPAALVAENGMDPDAAAAAVASLATRASALVGETFAAVSAELSFFPLPSAWELFGFDFMVDEDWNAYLLEANADPDVGASGETLKPLMAGLVEGTLARTADRVAGAVGAGVETPAVLPPGVWEEEGRDDETPGAWTRVFVRDAGRAGASGMRVA